MRISILLLAYVFSVFSFAESWSLESGKNIFDINTNLKNDGVLINYCFIFNNGRHLNCMNDSKNTLLIKGENECYITTKAINERTGDLFSLTICMKKNVLEWYVKEDQSYLPKKMILKKVFNN